MTSGNGRFGSRYKRARARTREERDRAWEATSSERWVEHNGKLYPKDTVQLAVDLKALFELR